MAAGSVVASSAPQAAASIAKTVSSGIHNRWRWAARHAAVTLLVGPWLRAQAWFVGGDTTGAIATGENSKDGKCYVDGEPDGESDGEHGVRVSATAYPRHGG